MSRPAILAIIAAGALLLIAAWGWACYWWGHGNGAREARHRMAQARARRQETPRPQPVDEPAAAVLDRRVPGALLPANLPAVEAVEVPDELVHRVHTGLSRWAVPHTEWVRDYAGQQPGRHHIGVAPGTATQRALMTVTAEWQLVPEAAAPPALIFEALGELPVGEVFEEPRILELVGATA